MLLDHDGRRKARLFILGATVLLAAACGTTSATKPGTAAQAATLPPLDRFCPDAQQLIEKTKLPVENVIFAKIEDYGLSKATIRPLSTRQYYAYADAGRTQLVKIGCKMKTSDHIRAEYGADAAGAEGLCADVNRRTLAAVLQSLTSAERRKLRFDRGRKIVFDDEQVTTNGFEYLADVPLAYVGTGGALHIGTRAMRNDWLDPKYANVEDKRFLGTRYCNFIAPGYLRRILIGEVTVGNTPPPPLGPATRPQPLSNTLWSVTPSAGRQ